MTANQATGGTVTLQNVHVHLGSGAAGFDAVQDVDLVLAAGSFNCLLGPSGCGKSTLLGAVAGHLTPRLGQIAIDANPVTGPDAERGIVFQHHTLLPWSKIIDNVAFGRKMKGIPRAERLEAAAEMLDMVGLADFADYYPAQLSGGMQQRAEIARVLINQPRVLLMDEPFGALDALTRTQMQHQLLDAWTQVPTTVLFVTHDIDEALFLGDRLLVMSTRPGRIIADIQLDFPRPRDIGILITPAFGELKAQCLSLLAGTASDASRLTPLGQGPARNGAKNGVRRWTQ